MYPQPSNKQIVHDKVGDAHILVVAIFTFDERTVYETQECCFV